MQEVVETDERLGGKGWKKRLAVKKVVNRYKL